MEFIKVNANGIAIVIAMTMIAIVLFSIEGLVFAIKKRCQEKERVEIEAMLAKHEAERFSRNNPKVVKYE